jgi:hypothetical protein
MDFNRFERNAYNFIISFQDITYMGINIFGAHKNGA